MSAQPIISIRNVTKRFGAFTALSDVSIDIEPGEFFALLGPSGCGKSTLLRIIAGFETPSGGEVLLDGEDMTRLAPNKRPVNMVFQSYAVFPHMSVAKNVAYGLRLDGLSRDEAHEKVSAALAQVHLQDFKDRMPDQLSGGQRQRVALARALVKRPRVLLLDEPLSALDARLRDEMRLELVKLQQSVGVSFIMVTHDQSEAMATADRIAVLDEGRLRQVASPMELYRAPCDTFVADFIGTINLFEPEDMREESGMAVITAKDIGECRLPKAAVAALGGALSGARLAVRPEKIRVFTGPPPPAESAARRAKLGDVAFQGDSSIVEIILESGRAISALANEDTAGPLLDMDPGADIWCAWDDADMLLLPEKSG
ncbi:MAG: ABC transporter ATP-binding protein [Rhodospirillales bacterium]